MNRTYLGFEFMADRKQLQSSLVVDPDLQRALDAARAAGVTHDELREQRVSFAYGNAPDSDLITKDTVRHSSEHIRFRA